MILPAILQADRSGPGAVEQRLCGGPRREFSNLFESFRKSHISAAAAAAAAIAQHLTVVWGETHVPLDFIDNAGFFVEHTSFKSCAEALPNGIQAIVEPWQMRCDETKRGVGTRATLTFCATRWNRNSYRQVRWYRRVPDHQRVTPRGGCLSACLRCHSRIRSEPGIIAERCLCYAGTEWACKT